MERKFLAFLMSAIMLFSLSACGGDDSTVPPDSKDKSESTSQKKEENHTSSSVDVSEPDESTEDDGTVESGTYTLPCGMKIQFYDSVRNDVTGNWRRAATSDSYIPADYAFEYYNEMFSSNDEIHSIWNATLGTNTRITVAAGILFVDTLEYVKGEEHDAKIMFSGNVLDSRMIDIETGEPIEG